MKLIEEYRKLLLGKRQLLPVKLKFLFVHGFAFVLA